MAHWLSHGDRFKLKHGALLFSPKLTNAERPTTNGSTGTIWGPQSFTKVLRELQNFENDGACVCVCIHNAA